MGKVETIKMEYKGMVEYGTSWTVDDAVANVVIITGMEEHSLMYDEFARFLNDHKFNAYALDNFGQGKNVFPDLSNLGIVPTSFFRKQVVMTDQLVEKLRISARPMFIFAHSVGSFFAQDYMQRYTHHVSKICLSGCAYRNYFTPLNYQCAKLLTTNKNSTKDAGLLGRLLFGNFYRKIPDPNKTEGTNYSPEALKFRWISSQPEIWQKCADDPLCGYGVNKGYCLELLKGMNRLYKKKFMQKIRKDLDVFIIAGEGDPVTHFGKDPEKLKKLYLKRGLKHVGAKVYPNSRHDVLRDTQKEQVFEDVLEFFKADIENKNVV